MHRHFFFRDRDDGVRRSRHGWGDHMARHAERAERHAERHVGRGRGFGRFFGHGDLRVVILALVEEQPRHGYELMKELEDRTGGAYRPSPGVVYPTLALLEDEGLIRPAASAEGGRKLFEITETGRTELDKGRTLVEGLFARMQDAAQHAGPGRPRVGRAMVNLGMALKNRMGRPITGEQLDRIVQMIDDTAAEIEKS